MKIFFSFFVDCIRLTVVNTATHDLVYQLPQNLGGGGGGAPNKHNYFDENKNHPIPYIPYANINGTHDVYKPV